MIEGIEDLSINSSLLVVKHADHSTNYVQYIIYILTYI